MSCISADSEGKQENRKLKWKTHRAVCEMWKTCFEFLNSCLFPLVLCLVFFDSSMVPQAFPTSPLLRLLCCILLFQWHITEVITCTRVSTNVSFFLSVSVVLLPISFIKQKKQKKQKKVSQAVAKTAGRSHSELPVHRGPSHLRPLLHFLSCWHTSAVDLMPVVVIVCLSAMEASLWTVASLSVVAA